MQISVEYFKDKFISENVCEQYLSAMIIYVETEILPRFAMAGFGYDWLFKSVYNTSGVVCKKVLLLHFVSSKKYSFWF